MTSPRTNPRPRLLALALLILLLSPRSPGGAEALAEPWPAGLRPGQSPGEVTKLLGAPGRVSRQVVAHRALEQWHYGPPHGLRLTFDTFRGQRPRLQSVRAAAAPPPPRER